MAGFPWSLPVFIVTGNGRAFSGIEGLIAQQQRAFQSLFGVLRLSSSALSPAFPPVLLTVPWWVPVWLCTGAPGPVLGQARLIEREGCSLLISSDSSILPEVGVLPHVESFHSDVTVLLWKKQTGPRLHRQLAKETRWVEHKEEKGETHLDCCEHFGLHLPAPLNQLNLKTH